MRLIIFGASGRTGRRLVEQALHGGYHLTAVVRDPARLPVRHDRLQVLAADLRPLDSHEVIVELIGATTTQTGLRVRAELDRGRYPFGSGCAMRSWRRCRLRGMRSTASGTTACNQRQTRHHRRQASSSTTLEA
jgi:hypothetical protein